MPIDLVGEGPGGVAVAGEDRRAVAVFVVVDDLHRRLVVGLRAPPTGPGRRSPPCRSACPGDPVEQAAADEEAVLVALHLEVAAVDDELRPLLDAEVDIAPDLVHVLR
jgi:hypothetical protein